MWGGGGGGGGGQFGPEEYAVVALMLALTLVVGVYFTFWARQDNYDEYMLAGRRMGVFPVTMSQVASHISGIAIVGVPAEVYSYGTLFAVAMISDLLVPFVNISLFLPIFFNLKLNSLFEYLELRFDSGVRVLGSLIFTISQILFLPAIIYVPALVFNQGLPVHAVSPVICAICIFYTTFGGLKAVLWTDALQNMFTLVAVVFVMVLGVLNLGGPSNVYRINKEGGRVEFFNMELSPFVRSSFWAMLVGNTMNWLGNLAMHPGAVQRCLAVPSLNQAKRSSYCLPRVLLWTSFGVFFVHGLTIYLGMIVYAWYNGCDPVATGEVKKTGQLVPLYVMEVARGYPGLAGLFVSGVLSAALSSMSSALNTMAGSLYQDLAALCLRGHKQTEAVEAWAMKGLSLLLGALGTGLVLAADRTDSIFQLGMSLYGVTNGALLTLFLLGIFIPKANSKGAVAGSLTSLVVMSWVVGNAYFYISTGKLRYRGKHTSVDLCPGNYSTDPEVLSRLETWRGHGSPLVADGVPLLYQVSYMYYSLLGTTVGVSVGLLVSLVTRASETPESSDTQTPKIQSHVDPRLFSPLVHRWLPSAPTITTAEELKLINRVEVGTRETEGEVVPPKCDIDKPE